MKKGFTLIELLAVIVILAIIALIATPIVLSIISDSKESSGLRSAEMYLDAVEQAISVKKMNNTSFNPDSCNITKEGNLYCDEDSSNLIKVEVNGETPINGSITFVEGKINDISLEYSDDKIIVKNEDGNLVYKEYTSLSNYKHKHIDGTVEEHEVTFDSNGHGTCSKCKEKVLAAGLYKNDGTFIDWNELLNYTKTIRCPQCNGILKENINIMTVTNNSLSTICSDVMNFWCENCSCGYYPGIDELDGMLVFDKNIIEITDFCFDYCNKLNGVILPDGLMSIGKYAFEGTGITDIQIPESVNNIKDCIFKECFNLISIELLNSEIIIGPEMFTFCNNTISIYYNGTKVQWNNVTKDSQWNSYYYHEITVHCTDGDIIIPAWTA